MGTEAPAVVFAEPVSFSAAVTWHLDIDGYGASAGSTRRKEGARGNLMFGG